MTMQSLGTNPASPPDPPAGLGDHGLALWEAVATRYSLRYGDELHVLEQAARTRDLVERLQDAIADADLMVKGSMGQMVANGLLAELRHARAQLQSFLKSLALPDEMGAAPTKSARHVRAANARWSQRDAAVTASRVRSEGAV